MRLHARPILALTVMLAAISAVPMAHAQQGPGPLRIEITEGVIEPLPFALPTFVAENAAAGQMSRQISRVIASDLNGTGLFRQIGAEAFIGRIGNFDSPIRYEDWRAINAQALITGAVSVGSSGRVTVKFRLFDVFAGQEMGEGLQLGGPAPVWRRLAHKVADAVYSRITGEGPYFDSRVVFVAEAGPKNDRRKRLAIMDQDGANIRYLTDDSSIVLAPRFSPDGSSVLYTSYESGFPGIHLLDLSNTRYRILDEREGVMTFAPRFAPDGDSVVYSLSVRGNTDIHTMNLGNGQTRRLTSAPSIETAPSYSPDGRRIVFESDRSGAPQLYVMSADGGEARRISFGEGRYGTPVWSPRGDTVAFTKQNAARFHIGVMRSDGAAERLLTPSFLDEGPTWAPNGRVLMFTREPAGAGGAPSLYTVDISGRNLRRANTDGAASDPAWSPLLP